MRITVYKLRWRKVDTGETGITQEFTGDGFRDVTYATKESAESAAAMYERMSLNTEIYTPFQCEMVIL